MELYLNEQEEQKSRNFLRHLGLDRTNLNQLLQLEKETIPQLNSNYTWKDIYGKSPTLNLEQYMKKSMDYIKNKLDIQTKEVLKKIDEYLLPEIKKQRDEKFIKQLVDHEHPYGLRKLLLEEKKQDYEYLVRMSKDTYDVLKDEQELAAKERKGIFGHREERVAELLCSVDDFIWQRYEIYRCKSIENIYETVLEIIENITYLDITKELVENRYD